MLLFPTFPELPIPEEISSGLTADDYQIFSALEVRTAIIPYHRSTRGPGKQLNIRGKTATCPFVVTGIKRTREQS